MYRPVVPAGVRRRLRAAARGALVTAALLPAIAPPAAPAATRAAHAHVVVMAAGDATGAAAVERVGGTVLRRLPALGGVVARVPAPATAALRRAPGVRAVDADRRVHLLSDGSGGAEGMTLAEVRVAVGAGGVPGSGSGVDVAIVDSGVSPVGGLEGRVVDGPDFSEDAADPAKRHLDGFGHGTHLAGIVAADGGIAPGARVVNVKIADHDGATSLGQILAGIDWAVHHRARGGLDIRVLNLAVGAAPGDGEEQGSDPLAVAVERAWRAGLTVVVAGGNGGAQATGLDSPASDPYVIAVTAADGDAVADFASRGTVERAPDVAAPGVGIVSLRVPGGLLDQAFPHARTGGGFRGSGTSQAAAAVAGVAALVIDARPDLRPDEVKALLRASARPLPGEPVTAQGAGVVDARAAAALPVPAGARQHHRPAGGAGPWGARSVALQFAAESPFTATRWSATRWSATRWSATRWSATRWSATRWSATRWSATRWSTAGWSTGGAE